jgi:hypothetical protein
MGAGGNGPSVPTKMLRLASAQKDYLAINPLHDPALIDAIR